MDHKMWLEAAVFDNYLSKSLTPMVVGMGREDWADRNIRVSEREFRSHSGTGSRELPSLKSQD